MQRKNFQASSGTCEGVGESSLTSFSEGAIFWCRFGVFLMAFGSVHDTLMQ